MTPPPVDHRMLSRFVGDLPHPPRVVVGGNAAVPWGLLALVDETVERYRLFMLNAPSGIPDRDGLTHETPFVGKGMRGSARLSYLPARLSQVPLLFGSTCPPDVVCVRTTPPRDGKVSLGIEVAALDGLLALADTDAPGSLTTLPAPAAVDAPAATDALARIGELVAARVKDGAVLQLGIGRGTVRRA